MRKAVDAPKGYHWMKAGKGFKLMKNPSIFEVVLFDVCLPPESCKFFCFSLIESIISFIEISLISALNSELTYWALILS